MKSLTTIIIILLNTVFLFAEGIVSINDNNINKQINLSGNIFYVYDTDNSLTFETVLSDDFKSKLTQSGKSHFNIKANSPDCWYIFEIENNTSLSQNLLLLIGNPFIKNLNFFSTTDSLHHQTGLVFNYHQRQIKHKNYIFEINLLPYQKGSYCIWIGSQDIPATLKIDLLTNKQLLKLNTFESIIKGAFYFIILVVLVFLIMLYLSENDKRHLYFLLLTLILFLLFLWRESALFAIIWPKSPMFNLAVGKVFYSIYILIFILFVNHFFNVWQKKQLLKHIKNLLIALYAFTSLLFIIYPNNIYISNFFNMLVVFTIAYIIYVIIKSCKKSIKYKNLYIGFSIILITQIIFEIYLNFNTKGLTKGEGQISGLSLIALSYIVFYEFFNSFRKSKNEIFKLNKNLEQMVELRTSQLNSQKEELKSQQEELILQKETLQTQREELRAQKELLEIKNNELEKLSLVASKTDNLIYILQPNGDIDWFNSSFGMLFGRVYEDYKNHEPVNIVDISNNRNIKHVLNTCLREKTAVTFESMNEAADGQKLWYQTSLTPILDEHDNIKLLIAIDTDITQIKQYEFEIEQQSKDAELQKNLAINRKEELEAQQIEITDSIRYAKRIQTAILPSLKQLQRDFDDSFVLFLPKDIVSGDFYWYHRDKDKYYIAAIDCTGHGVPGAFMSIIGNYLLNSIIINKKTDDQPDKHLDPAEILKQLNRKIKISLKTDSFSQGSDGMDVAMVIIDKKNKKLQFASALRPLFLFQNGDFIEVKGEKIPITSNISSTSLANFTTHEFDFNQGDMFYIFSDGIIDQFGGEKGKKFLTKRFKDLLFDINPLPMREQKDIIKKTFDEWRGNYEQVDDILVIGMRYSINHQ